MEKTETTGEALARLRKNRLKQSQKSKRKNYNCYQQTWRGAQASTMYHWLSTNRTAQRNVDVPPTMHSRVMNPVLAPVSGGNEKGLMAQGLLNFNQTSLIRSFFQDSFLRLVLFYLPLFFLCFCSAHTQLLSPTPFLLAQAKKHFFFQTVFFKCSCRRQTFPNK